MSTEPGLATVDRASPDGRAATVRRPAARVGRLTMGPGGWVSFKGGRAPDPTDRRPWWAVLLRARRLGQ